eukprot:IDg21504t1
MAEPAERKSHKLSTGEVFDLFGNTWDGPEDVRMAFTCTVPVEVPVGGTDYDRDISARSGYIMEIIPRSRRYGPCEAAGNPDFGNAAAHSFAVSFYRTHGEAAYGIRLRAFVNYYPRLSDRVSAEPHLLCLGTRFPRNFRFLPHGGP